MEKQELYSKYPEFWCGGNEQICEFFEEWDEEGHVELMVQFLPCWKKDRTVIKKMPFEEFIKYNFFDLCNEIRNYPIPENHVYTYDSHCHPNRGCCDWRYSPLKKVAVSIQPFCNVKCTFCPVLPGRRMTHIQNKIKDAYFKSLYEVKDKGIEISLTCHGEPFLWKKETFEWLESLTPGKNAGIQVVTNSTLLTDEDIEHLARIRDEKQVAIIITTSINGITKEAVEKIQQCKIPDFDAYINRVLKLFDYGLLGNINHVFTTENVDTLPDFFKFWTSKRVELEPRLVPLVDASHPNEVVNSKVWKDFFAKKETSKNNSQIFYNTKN